MRKTRIALLTLACVAAAGRAQQPAPARPAAPPAPAALDPGRNALDAYLLRWEEAMKKVDTLALKCTRTETDPIYKTKHTYEGTIHFMRPNFFFWNMQDKTRPAAFERFICTGVKLYQFLPRERLIKVYPAPQVKPGGGLADDSSIAFLFGMKAAEARARYDLSLHKTDKDYVYVDVIPKKAVDKADFTKARIVLNKDTYLPRMLWFEHPNQGEVLWDIPTIQANSPIPRTAFGTPATPKGWKMVDGRASAQRGTGEQPKLYRPKN